MNRRVLLAAILLLGATAAAREAPPTYRFFLNDDPITPRILSLHGEPETPRPGDLVEIHDYLLVLEEPGEYRLHIDWKDVATPLHREVGEERRLVAATAKPSGKVTLTGLDAGVLAGLRGVRLAVWSDEVAEKLAGLDPELCALTLDQGIGASAPGLGLPAKTRHLRLAGIGTDRLGQAFAGLPELRSLLIRSYGVKLDGRAFPEGSPLRLLHLTAKSVADTMLLARFTELRDLEVTLYSGRLVLEGVRRIETLRRIALSITPVRDLTPLGGHPRLRHIKADSTPLATLPAEPLPELRRLDVMGTRLTDEAVAAFARLHPECRIRHRMDQVLEAELAGATRLRIRSGGTCHRNRKEERTLLEVTDPNEVSRIAAAIRLEGPSPSCACCGEPTLEFYRGEKLVAELGFHHGRTLRWPGVWPFDGALTEEAAAFLTELLNRR